MIDRVGGMPVAWTSIMLVTMAGLFAVLDTALMGDLSSITITASNRMTAYHS